MLKSTYWGDSGDFTGMLCSEIIQVKPKFRKTPQSWEKIQVDLRYQTTERPHEAPKLHLNHAQNHPHPRHTLETPQIKMHNNPMHYTTTAVLQLQTKQNPNIHQPRSYLKKNIPKSRHPQPLAWTTKLAPTQNKGHKRANLKTLLNPGTGARKKLLKRWASPFHQVRARRGEARRDEHGTGGERREA